MPTWTTSRLEECICRLEATGTLLDEELVALLSSTEASVLDKLYDRACAVRERHYGRSVYIRGLIELTNICRNDCYYCGIRRSNRDVARYRLTEAEVLECCEHGYELGFRTFVLQGGEDPYWTADRVVALIEKIRLGYPACAITLSLGEWSAGDYARFFEAGADRYLLRHETFDPLHYNQLHPSEMSADMRQECLRTLKRLGFQTGTGIMVGSPRQTMEHIIADIRFIEALRPEMIGIGPFLPHRQTPFAECSAGSLELTLKLLAIFRLMHPQALIPSTTALATLHPEGRIKGILAGANVVMPNLSPQQQRSKYQLYDDKASLGAEAAEGLALLEDQLASIGYSISYSRGDCVRAD